MFLYDPIGKTLEEVHKDCGASMSGYAVFVLENENDNVGKQLDEDISIGLILRKHPEYTHYRVKYTNDFFGETVLRVLKDF